MYSLLETIHSPAALRQLSRVQLKTLADSARQIDAAGRSEMPELDWSGWDAMRAHFDGPPGQALDDALWFSCEALVPATLLWLRVYQQSQPELFRMGS